MCVVLLTESLAFDSVQRFVTLIRLKDDDVTADVRAYCIFFSSFKNFFFDTIGRIKLLFPKKGDALLGLGRGCGHSSRVQQ